jgi:ElaB/YqjD/DUF883 family membrane-anchored ribosome-binding protein
MSNDENSKDSVDLGEKLEELKDKTTEMASNAADTISETVEETVESISETVEEAKETVSEVVEDVVEASSEVKDNAVAKIMELKNSNPKAFFGGIGALVLVILIIMMSGGSNNPLPVAKIVNVAVGQSYTLKGVNTTDPSATVRLAAVPGSMAAYDDTEGEEDACKHIPQGTKVKAIQIQEVFGKAKMIEVEMLEGNCAGRKGWVFSNNLN